MKDSAIKSYCVWARRELMSEVERRCAIYDISESPTNPADADAVNGLVLTGAEKEQRRELLGTVREEGYGQIVERAAYTWFNRIMAIRFMEVNDLLPSRTRMLSTNDGSFKPQVLTEALSVDIEGLDRARTAGLVQGGDDEATFRCLFLAQCAELADCMPDVFEKVGAAMELLLPDGLLREGGVVNRIVTDIPESDWREGVQIVGWMYQYYVSEKKDEYFTSKRKASAKDIPCATQLFTPEWIVRYLAENSLGRLWMLNNPQSGLASKMDYYLAPEGGADEFLEIDDPEEITVLDPACGSGHILVYAFDLLAAMYEERGYARRDIPQLVLEKNLTGIEIDPRAAAMASFALTMKACEYDGRFLRRDVRPRITVLEKVELDEEQRRVIADMRHKQERLDAPFLLGQTELLETLAHLDEVGSLLTPTTEDMDTLCATAASLEDETSIFGFKAKELISRSLAELEPLATKYDVVIANPPYLQKSTLEPWASEWIKEQYPEENNDLCTCFIKRGLDYAKHDGYVAEITMQSWMFLSSYERMRKKLVAGYGLVSMAHLGAHAFDAIGGEVVSTTATVFVNDKIQGKGTYFRLVDGSNEAEKSAALREAIQNPDCGWLYRADAESFKSIPGSPIAYWLPSSSIDSFKCLLKDSIQTKIGFVTGDNERFLRLWTEVSLRNIKFDAVSTLDSINSYKKWFPCQKGGDFRRWYGNNDYVVNWWNDGYEAKNNNKTITGRIKSHNYNDEVAFQDGLTYNSITSSLFTARYVPSGYMFNVAGPLIQSTLDYHLLAGFLNSSVAQMYLRLLNPTINMTPGYLESVPNRLSEANDSLKRCVIHKAGSCIKGAKQDWDSFETSWNFTRHPLLPRESGGCVRIADTYNSWSIECRDRFDTLKTNEEELNHIFARIYLMEGEVPIEVPDDKVSVRRADLVRDVKSLISYAVGCIMGRYSLDKPGLVLANKGDGLGEYLEQVPDPTFKPDEDGIIPLTDIEYFHDDAMGLFVDFLRAAYGDESLEENLEFVADALGGDGTPRQIIRGYFRNDFFADHCKTYSVTGSGKRPIYWLFDSGKRGGFRALFYMHRYTPDLLARLRTEYVHPQQERYRTQLERIDDAMQTADKREQATLRKEHKKIADQLAETNAYEEKVHHLADQMIEIDLDDGVRHNYALFQDVLAKIK